MSVPNSHKRTYLYLFVSLANPSHSLGFLVTCFIAILLDILWIKFETTRTLAFQPYPWYQSHSTLRVLPFDIKIFALTQQILTMAYTTPTPQSETHILSTPTIASLSKHFSYKMDSLYEIKYLDNESRLLTTNLTFLNPCHNSLKPLTSFCRTINTFINLSIVKIKEYVQSTSFSSYQLSVTTIE